MNKYGTWCGKPFTVKGAVLMFALALVYLPMHEFGHWLAYWIFGIPAEFGIMYNPLSAVFVQPAIMPSFHIQMFVAFFGGGFVFIVAGIVSIRSRPSLLMAAVGLAAGITELAFRFVAETQDLDFPMLIQSHFELYIALQVVPFIMVFLLGLPEFRRWLRSLIFNVRIIDI